MTPRPILRVALGALLACLLALPSLAQTGSAATLVYRKIFKDSSPEFMEIRLREDGAGTVDMRQLDDDPEPDALQVSAPLAAKMFDLARELNFFRELDLDVKRRIANLGQKTFRYERGREAYEVTFNYTTNPAATQLLQIFEGLSRQHEHLAMLNRRLRYDRLGVNEALLKFEIDLNKKMIPEPERLLPVLESIAKDARVVEIARARARALVERIRNSGPS